MSCERTVLAQDILRYQSHLFKKIRSSDREKMIQVSSPQRNFHYRDEFARLGSRLTALLRP